MISTKPACYVMTGTDMKFIDFFYFVIFRTLLLTLNLKIGYAVPPEYCLHQLNTSDCRAKPSPVFFYYKPGSRCELDTWRGCPTYNKFDNQYQCISTCIYKYRDSSENIIYKYDTPNENFFVEDGYEMNFEDEIDTLPAKEKLILQKILDDIKKTVNTTTSTTTSTNETDYQELTHLSTEESMTLKSTTVGVESTPKKPTTNQKTAQKVERTTNHITKESTTHEEPTTTQLIVTTKAEPTTTYVTTTSTEPTTETKMTDLTTPIVTSSKTTINDEDIPRPSTKPTTTATTTAAIMTQPSVVTEKITTTVVSTTNKNISSGEADEVIIMRNKHQ